MELSVREWMMIVGMLLIVAVFLDGYRRVRNERRNRIRVSLSKSAFQFHDDDDVDVEPLDPTTHELPNGGARVIPKHQRDDLQLHESVPLLMESVRVGRATAPEAPAALVEATEPEPPSAPSRPPFAQKTAARIEPTMDEPAAIADDGPVQPWADDGADDDEDYEEDVVVAAPPAKPVPTAEASAVPVNATPQEVLIINVLSKDEAGFRGPDLLQILLACDLRFGKMNIFHRYEKANGRGQVQFSVANLTEPGTFNLDGIDGFCTPGVSFFLALPGPEEPIRAFDYMVETAQVLVKNLQAELRDEAQSAITAQTLEHCRQRIRDFERKQLTLHV